MSTRAHTFSFCLSLGVALFFGVSVEATAQFRISPVTTIGNRITCHVGGQTYERTPNKELIYRTYPTSYAPTYRETQEIFDKISDYTELTTNIYTVPVTDDEVNVEICPGDVNYIAYNPTWLKSVYDDTNNLWAVYAIVAHEIGHYANNHDRKSVGSNRNLELEADEYSGAILAKMGACLPDAQAAFDAQVMKRNIPNHTHPPIAERFAAVWRGWKEFGKCPWDVISIKGVAPGSGYSGSFGYIYQGSGLKLAHPDDLKQQDSKLVLLENGRRLVPHGLHANIQGIGRGLYSHWFDGRTTYLWFSASDNSDPRTNGREYAITVSK
jgi:hypothetical protein